MNILEKIKIAKDAGYTDQEVQAYLKSKGIPWQPTPADVKNEKGLISEIPGVSPALSEGTRPLAEAVGETTQIPEKIRSPLSGTIGIASEIAGAFMAPKAAKAVVGIGKQIGAGVMKSVNKVKAFNKTPSVQDVQEKLLALEPEGREALALLEGQKLKAGEKIGEVEAALGLGMKKIPAMPKNVNKFADKMKELSDLPMAKLTQTPIEKLQALKKTAQIAKRNQHILPEARAFINKGVSQIDKAIALLEPKIAAARKPWLEIDRRIQKLPDALKDQKAQLRLDLLKAKDKEKLLNKLKWGAVGAGGAVSTGATALAALKYLLSRKGGQ